MIMCGSIHKTRQGTQQPSCGRTRLLQNREQDNITIIQVSGQKKTRSYTEDEEHELSCGIRYARYTYIRVTSISVKEGLDIIESSCMIGDQVKFA